MFILAHFYASVMYPCKPFTPQHSNKNILVQVDQSQDRVKIHTDAYTRALPGYAVAT